MFARSLIFQTDLAMNGLNDYKNRWLLPAKAKYCFIWGVFVNNYRVNVDIYLVGIFKQQLYINM